jgi:ATP-binding cassette subfamily F protein 3
MITVNDIAVEFGGTTLFSEVTFAINENDKIALMGKNGAGKSTLLKIVAGESKPTRGSIWHQVMRLLLICHSIY